MVVVVVMGVFVCGSAEVEPGGSKEPSIPAQSPTSINDNTWPAALPGGLIHI